MFRFIRFVLTYLPLIVSTVKMIEAVTDRDTAGEDKKTLALAVIIDLLKSFGVTVTSELEEFISRVIDVVVRALNLLGVFTHADPEAPAEPEAEGVVAAAQAAAVAQAIRDAPIVNGHDYNDERLAELERLLSRE